MTEGVEAYSYTSIHVPAPGPRPSDSSGMVQCCVLYVSRYVQMDPLLWFPMLDMHSEPSVSQRWWHADYQTHL